MKSILGLVGVLLVLAIVSLLMKTQLKSTSTAAIPVVSSMGTAITPTQRAMPAQQSQQIQQQVKDLVNATLQTPRLEGEEKLNAEDK